MLNQTRNIARVVAEVARLRSARAFSAHGPYVPPRKLPTFNDLPVPNGSWKDAYAARQRKYNMQLGFTLAFFILSALYVYQQGIIDLNRGPSMKNKKE